MSAIRKLAAGLLLLPVLLLTACDSTQPTTKATAQQSFDGTFKTLRTTIASGDSLAVKNHQGRMFVPGTCNADKAQYTDTSAVYVPKTYDQQGYLKKLQTKLNGDGYQTSLGVAGGYDTLTMSKNGYNYQAIATTKVKDTKIDTNKAILFVGTSPCMDPKA